MAERHHWSLAVLQRRASGLGELLCPQAFPPPGTVIRLLFVVLFSLCLGLETGIPSAAQTRLGL